eukprot:gene1523-1916_t
MVKIVGLISGGKDSIYNLIECVRNGHEIVALANLKPPSESNKEELDSYMYQTVGSNIIEYISKCMELPLFQIEINGTPKSIGENYSLDKTDEVEDLYNLLHLVKQNIPDVKGISCGAIFSSYQRVRVEDVCSRLGLVCYAYLWRRDQDELLQEMIQSRVNAIIIKVASMGLEPSKHLGKSIQQLYPTLKSLFIKYGVHICGEGGEYESIVLDCPLYKRSLKLESVKQIVHSDDEFAQVVYLSIESCSFVEKSMEQIQEESKYLLPRDINRDNLLKFDEEKLTNCIKTTIDNNYKTTTYNYQLLSNPNNSDSNNNCIITQSSRYFYIKSYSVTVEDSNNDYSKILETILNNLSQTLEEKFSLDFQSLLYVNLYVDDLSQFGVINQAYFKFFKNNPSARACIQANIGGNGNRIMVDCIGTLTGKKNLHVQSISNWAPACIGPYSQSTMSNGLLFLAGQIGMVPGTLDIVDGGLEVELKQILFNTFNLLDALNCDGYSSTIQATVFITNPVYLDYVYHYLLSFFEEEQNQQVLIQIYTVPKLPKAAKIEILFIQSDIHSNNNDSDDEDGKWNQKQQKKSVQSFSKTIELDSNSYKINSKLINNQQKSKSSILNLQFSIINGSKNNIDIDSKSIQHLVEYLKELIQSELKKTNNSIVYMKFYYQESISTQIQSDISLQCQNILGLNQISFVPVGDIKNLNNINIDPTSVLMGLEILFDENQ